MSRLLAVAILGPALLAFAELPGPWAFPDAVARLRVAPLMATSHTLRVPVPDHLQEPILGARARTSAGKTLPCILLISPRTEKCVEIQIRLDKEERALTAGELKAEAPIAVYLFTTAQESPAPARTPVVVRAVQAGGNARPGTCDTFLGYWRRYAPFTTYDELPDLAADPDFGRLEKQQERRRSRRRSRDIKILWHASTVLQVSMARELNFGIPEGDYGAWFLFLNRQPIFSWGEATHDDLGYAVSPRQVLEPGLHQLDFFGIVDSEEEVPVLAYRDMQPDSRYQRFGTHELWSPNTSLTIDLAQPDDVLVQGVSLQPLHAFYLPETGQIIDQWQYADLSRNLFGRPFSRQRLHIGGQLLGEPAGTLYLPRQRQLPVQLEHRDRHGYHQQLSFKLEPGWQPPELVRLHFDPVRMPFLAPQQANVPLKYELRTSDDFSKRLLSAGNLLSRRYDRSGDLISAYAAPIPASPFRRYFTLLELSRQVARIDLHLTLGAQPVGKPIPLYHILPTDPPDFRPSAGLLRYRDGLALLAREQLPPPTYQRPTGPLSRLTLVDGYIATSAHPTDDLPVTTWLNEQSPGDLDIHHHPLLADPLAASHPRLAKYVALPQLLASDSDAIIWAIGSEALRQDSSIPDVRTELAFLAETTLAHGKLPILVNLPIRGEWTRERLRPYALQVMELAAAYDIPVVDLYSSSLKRQNIDVFYRLDDQGTLTSQSPNAKGRDWFLSQILQTVQRYNTERSR